MILRDSDLPDPDLETEEPPTKNRKTTKTYLKSPVKKYEEPRKVPTRTQKKMTVYSFC